MIACGLLFAVAGASACGKGNASGGGNGSGAASSSPPPAAAAAEVGLASLPAETRVILHIDVTRAAGSPFVRGAVAAILATDPEAEGKLAHFLDSCHIGPDSVASLTIGMAEADDVALVVVGKPGKLDTGAFLDCVRAEIAATGGTFTQADKVYAASSKLGSKIWLGFGTGGTLVAATSQAWLGKVLDGKADKIGSRAETMALIGRVSPDDAAWAVGYLPPGVGDSLVKLAEGKIAKPAVSVSFEAKLTAGLAATLSVDMQSSADADALAAFVKSQMDWLAIVAQRFSLGQMMAKVKVTAATKTVNLAVALDEKDLATLGRALSGAAQPTTEKATPTPDKAGPKKEQ